MRVRPTATKHDAGRPCTDSAGHGAAKNAEVAAAAVHAVDDAGSGPAAGDGASAHGLAAAAASDTGILG